MDIMSLLRQAQEMKKTMETAQADLEKLTVIGTSGGGMVSVETNGHGPDGPPIHPAADRGSPLWRRQPDRTVPKYGRGPIDPTQAQ